MKRVVISLGLLAGCVAPSGDESFIIRSNLAPEVGGDCFFTASIDAPAISRGQIFAGSTIPYLFHPLLESRIVAPVGRESLRTIFIEGADVDLEVGPIETIDSAGNVFIDDTVETVAFRSLFTAALPPNGGVAASQLDLVPLSVLAGVNQAFSDPTLRVHAQITATITAFGDYYGESIESAPFVFPVTVCNDCVLGNRAPDGTFPACAGFAGTPRTGNGCNVFQDGIVDCCDTGNGIQCPAVPVGPET